MLPMTFGWSFGTLVFQILAGHPFWVTNEEDNFVEMKELLRFNSNRLQTKDDNVNGISSEAKDL